VAGGKGSDDDGDAWGWADTFQQLIAAGHRRRDIDGYTLKQVEAFMSAIERQRRNLMVGEAIAMRMAQADGKAWKKYITGLRRGD